MPRPCAVLLLSAGLSASASAQSWPEVFNPMQVLHLNLQLDPVDWETIQNDLTFSIEVPAQFWADGEQPILVSIRRKSCDAIQNGTAFKKVSFKIDVNELVNGQSWRGVNKLSIENGDDQDVVSEGLAWHMHRLASGPAGYGYTVPAALAAWVRLTINGVNTGLYLNPEQRDKRFLENRALYIQGQTWLYEVEDAGQLEIEVGTGDSPTVAQLCYLPFEPGLGGPCPAPPQAVMIAQVDQLVNMRSLLTMAAVDAITGNPDAIFSHGKNFFFADFAGGAARMYFPWDLDSVMGGNAGNIYQVGSAYSGTLLSIPAYRAQYSQIANALLCGPLQQSTLLSFVNAVEPILTPHLAGDPNNQIGGDIAGFFNSRRSWLTNRLNHVRTQVEGFVPCAPPCYANCDASTAAPILTANDFQCFLDKFAAGDPYANCDGSTSSPVLTANDFQCFLDRFAGGCT